MKRRSLLALTSLIVALASADACAAQADPDGCSSVRGQDAATLMTLNQALVTAEPDGSDRCSFKVENSFGTVGRLDLTTQHFKTHADAVAYMKNDLPFYLDKKLALVKTDDSSDHVDTVLTQPASAEAEAVHGNVVTRVDINEVEPGARAHPSFEYRLERLALQAAGATILPTAGLPPDPVLPTRQPAAVDSSSGHDSFPGAGWLTGGLFGIVGLALLGPAIAIFFLYRFLIGPWLRRGRLLKTGLDGTARIDSVADTGVTINNSPQVLYHCTVTPASGGPPYQASIRTTVSRLVAPASLLGTTRAVKIDPAKPSVFVFV